ncbi:MAG: hypothetical protein AB7E95_00425 [Kiritimatiellales bacterium]
MFACQATLATDVATWKKATPDGDWGTASNWYDGIVPGSTYTVTIWGKAVITHMPEINYDAGLISALGLNWNFDTNQTAKLTLTGSSAFLKVTAGTYLNRSSGSSISTNGLSAEIDILDGAIFQTVTLRMGSGADNSIAINIGADSELRVWHPIASTADILDWGSGNHTINLIGANASFSITGPSDQTAIIQNWIDSGYITRNSAVLGGFNLTYDATRKLTTVVGIPKTLKLIVVSGVSAP